MSDTEEGDEVPIETRRPICVDCRGTGQTHQPRAFATREFPGEMRQLMVPAKCQACRGSGKAGV